MSVIEEKSRDSGLSGAQIQNIPRALSKNSDCPAVIWSQCFENNELVGYISVLLKKTSKNNKNRPTTLLVLKNTASTSFNFTAWVKIALQNCSNFD